MNDKFEVSLVIKRVNKTDTNMDVVQEHTRLRFKLDHVEEADTVVATVLELVKTWGEARAEAGRKP